MSDVTLRMILLGEDRSASKATKDVATNAQRNAKAVGNSIAGMGRMVGGEVGDLISRVGEGLTQLGEHGKQMGKSLMVGGAAVAGLGGALSMLGSKDKEASNALKAAMLATGSAMSDYKEEIEAVIKKQQGYNHSAADTQQALASLTESTGSPKKALESMGVVADLAAAKHIDLNSAAQLLGRGLNGATKVFKQYGIQVQSTASASGALTKAEDSLTKAQAAKKLAQAGLVKVQEDVRKGTLTGAAAQKALKTALAGVESASSKVTAKQLALKYAHKAVKDASESTKDAVDQLGKKLDGQAASSVDSFSGHLKVMKTKIEDAAAAFGQKYGPALQVGGAVLAGVGTVMQVVATRQLAAAAATEAATVATEAQTVATAETETAQWGLNAALLANPIGLIVIAIVGLIALFVILWKHSDTFKQIVIGAFHAVTGAAQAAFSWIKDHWKLILSILTGPIGTAVIFIVSHWKQIRNGLSDVLGDAKDLWNGFMKFLRGIPGKIGGALSGMWHGITSSFRGAINDVIDIWNRLHFTIPSIHAFGKTIGGGTVGVPHIPHLARGGILATAGQVMVGDRGRELLTLDAGARVDPLPPGGGSGGDLGTVTLVVQSEDGRELQRKLLNLKRTNGGLALGLA